MSINLKKSFRKIALPALLFASLGLNTARTQVNKISNLSSSLLKSARASVMQTFEQDNQKNYQMFIDDLVEKLKKGNETSYEDFKLLGMALYLAGKRLNEVMLLDKEVREARDVKLQGNNVGDVVLWYYNAKNYFTSDSNDPEMKVLHKEVETAAQSVTAPWKNVVTEESERQKPSQYVRDGESSGKNKSLVKEEPTDTLSEEGQVKEKTEKPEEAEQGTTEEVIVKKSEENKDTGVVEEEMISDSLVTEKAPVFDLGTDSDNNVRDGESSEEVTEVDENIQERKVEVEVPVEEVEGSVVTEENENPEEIVYDVEKPTKEVEVTTEPNKIDDLDSLIIENAPVFDRVGDEIPSENIKKTPAEDEIKEEPSEKEEIKRRIKDRQKTFSNAEHLEKQATINLSNAQKIIKETVLKDYADKGNYYTVPSKDVIEKEIYNQLKRAWSKYVESGKSIHDFIGPIVTELGLSFEEIDVEAINDVQTLYLELNSVIGRVRAEKFIRKAMNTPTPTTRQAQEKLKSYWLQALQFINPARLTKEEFKWIEEHSRMALKQKPKAKTPYLSPGFLDSFSK